MVQHHQVEQGGRDWLRLRMGRPTASLFHRIVTPTGRASKQARAYAFRLAAERLLARPFESLASTEHMEHGKEHEAEAVRMYEWAQELETVPCGFFTTDDGRIGASPDRLIIGHSAVAEIKCPAAWTHLEYLLDGWGADYTPQVQGQLLVCEADWCGRISYHPDMPPVTTRTHRDEAYLATLQAALDEFCDLVDDIERRARATGYFAERFAVATDELIVHDDGRTDHWLGGL